MTATEAALAIRSGALTSEALVRACLARVDDLDPSLQAWAFIDREDAIARARASDRLREIGSRTGPLHGVPFGVKDVIDAFGMPTECGSPLFRGFRPEQNAPVVALLEAAGGIPLGKTVTTELAGMAPSPTRHPRNPAHTPGGSSSGSAVAVATGMVPIALGTQTSGSVIRPAAFCGAFAMKPTFGLVPRRGVLLQSHTLDTVGFMARSLDDLALIAGVACRHDPDDPASVRYAGADTAAVAADVPPATPKLAFVKTPAWDETDPVTREAFAELTAELGECVAELELPGLADAIEAQRTIIRAENAAYYGPFARRAPDQLSTAMLEHLKIGSQIPAREYIDAVRLREVAYAGMLRALEGFSAVLTPAAPGPAPASLVSTGNPVFNGVWTYLGVPAVTLPLLEADGMPLGVQLVGRRYDDARLLQTAKWLVQKLGG